MIYLAREPHNPRLATTWMERTCFLGSADVLTKLGNTPDMVVKRLVRHNQPVGITLDTLGHIIWLDFSKLGRVAQTQVNDGISFCKKFLELNPARSVAFIVPPLLASASVGGSALKGEHRRIEDKCEEHGIATRPINLSMDQSRLHGNCDIPSNYMAMLAVLDDTLPAKGLQHRARVDQDTTQAAKGNENVSGTNLCKRQTRGRVFSEMFQTCQ